MSKFGEFARAHTDGYHAYACGHAVESNPYIEGDDPYHFTEWREGWLEAKKDAEEYQD